MPSPADLEAAFQHKAAEERIRRRQQGEGRPLVAFKMGDHQFVGVGNSIYWSKNWRTFGDFLFAYTKTVLGPEWGDAELAKPYAERHPLLQWYETMSRYQATKVTDPSKVTSYPLTGAVASFAAVGYAIYQRHHHNAGVMERFIRRLKDVGQFQGAFYELLVASTLIRAGFTLVPEDEADRASKHCEFAAISKKTGKRYWVEAKMRAIDGQLGRTAADGGAGGLSLRKLVKHLNQAFGKPAADDRLIFLDVNVPTVMEASGEPDWLAPVFRRLAKYEKEELGSHRKAYVYVTNLAFYRDLHGAPTLAASPYGLGYFDFNRPGEMRVSEAYRRKQRHIDAYDIGYALKKLLDFPSTFDGRLPSDAFGGEPIRVLIGQTYQFGDGDDAIIGRVTSATVDEGNKQMIVAVHTDEGKSYLMKRPMSDVALDDYRQNRDSYFGEHRPGPHQPKNAFELFEWLMAVPVKPAREMMTQFLAPHYPAEELLSMSDADLQIAYCEAMVAAVEQKTGPWKSPT